jgi:hypothetical protein
MGKISVGSRVFDKADPRHVGVVLQTNLGEDGRTAKIRWEETGWVSCRVPAGDLRLAPKDGEPARGAQFNMKRALAGKAKLTNTRGA